MASDGNRAAPRRAAEGAAAAPGSGRDGHDRVAVADPRDRLQGIPRRGGAEAGGRAEAAPPVTEGFLAGARPGMGCPGRGLRRMADLRRSQGQYCRSGVAGLPGIPGVAPAHQQEHGGDAKVLCTGRAGRLDANVLSVHQPPGSPLPPARAQRHRKPPGLPVFPERRRRRRPLVAREVGRRHRPGARRIGLTRFLSEGLHEVFVDVRELSQESTRPYSNPARP